MTGIHFDETNTINFFPGAFEIIDSAFALLNSRLNSIAEKQKTNTMIPINDQRSILGILSSSLILLGHTTGVLGIFMAQLCLIHFRGNVFMRLGRDTIFRINLLRIETLSVDTRASASGIRWHRWQIKCGIAP